MTIDEAYRSVFDGIKVPHTLIEMTKCKIAGGSGRARRTRTARRAATACVAFAAIAAVASSGVFRLGSVGTIREKSGAAAGGSGSQYAGALGADSSAASSLAAVGGGASSRQTGPHGNVNIFVYRIYGGRFYRGGTESVSESDLGEKLADEKEQGSRNASCYEIRGVPISQSIAFDYNGTVVRYDSFMSSHVTYKGNDYTMVESWTGVGRDAPPVGEKLGEYDGMALYAAGGEGEIWVDVLPKLGEEDAETGDRRLYLAVASK